VTSAPGSSFARSRITKTLYQVVAGAAAFGLTVLGAWYLLRIGISLPASGVIMLVLPTSLMTVTAAIYGAFTGWKPPTPGTPVPVRERQTDDAVVLLLLGSLVFLLAVGALYAGMKSRLIQALWLGTASSLVAACGAAWLRDLWRGADSAALSAPSGDPTTRRLRLLLFGFVVAGPATLAVLFFRRGDTQQMAIFAIIAAAIAPWALKKARAEWGAH
jgi:hypothetical protein